ncbi:hypothetical protein P692DRAFT_20867680 [Suillus brevipes Sb2]|nr:hypothetical protein P692DRAFT_20867680 [Suillus brevipes Sb2]
MSPAAPEEYAVSELAELLLRACEEWKGFCARQTDVCIIDETEILLVQEDKRHMDSSDVEPQLIGSRTNPRSAKPLLHSEFITGITPKGTAPTFYKVEVTAALVMAVAGGNYSEASTTAYAHVPNVLRPNCQWDEDARPLESGSYYHLL